MTKRKGDPREKFPGGAAAERLRMFTKARKPADQDTSRHGEHRSADQVEAKRPEEGEARDGKQGRTGD
jgi:hypothetical protein